MNKLSLWYPVKPAIIRQPFGANGDYYKKWGIPILGHNGIDFPAAHGQRVYAAHEGTVTLAGDDGSGGYGVVIGTNHKYAYLGGESYFKSIYWHLIPQIPVKVGTRVDIGDCIGFADSTGLATYPHLHFGLKPVALGELDWMWYNTENGYNGAIDPLPYFNGYFSQDKDFVIATLCALRDSIKKLLSFLKLLNE